MSTVSLQCAVAAYVYENERKSRNGCPILWSSTTIPGLQIGSRFDLVEVKADKLVLKKDSRGQYSVHRAPNGSPFDAALKVSVSPQEIRRLFGPDGFGTTASRLHFDGQTLRVEVPPVEKRAQRRYRKMGESRKKTSPAPSEAEPRLTVLVGTTRTTRVYSVPMDRALDLMVELAEFEERQS